MRTRRRSALLLAPVLAVTLSLAACGGDEEDSAGDSSPSAADLVVTGVDGIRWDSDSYTATAGDVAIELRNTSSLPHNLIVLAADGTQVGPELHTAGRGQEETGTFPLTAGTYTILCTIPGHGAMTATLTVS